MAALEVLYNDDLTRIICVALQQDIVRHGVPVVNGQKTHPILSLALTSKSVSTAALDCLWEELDGFKPLLYIFPVTLTAYSNLRILPDHIPEETWERFDDYACRVKTLNCQPQTRIGYSSSIFMRFLHHREILFPNLRRLSVDMAFATDPTVVFIYFSPRLFSVELLLDATPDRDICFSAIHGVIGWLSNSLENLVLSCTQGERQQPLLPEVCPSIAFQPALKLSTLRSLSLSSHPIDSDYLAFLSKLSLEHLVVRLVRNVPSAELVNVGQGFKDLLSLYISADVTMMLSILQLFTPGGLESLCFTDTSNLVYEDRSGSMRHLHAHLDAQFALTVLELNYPNGHQHRLHSGNDSSTMLVFRPITQCLQLRELTYRAELSIRADDATFPPHASWRSLRSLRIESAYPVHYTLLPKFATSCPDLLHLGLQVEFPANGPLDSFPRSDHRLQSLDAGAMPVKRAAIVAGLIDRCFPFLCDGCARHEFGTFQVSTVRG